MDIKGVCYFSKIHSQHIIIFLTNPDENGLAFLVPLSSIKFNENGKYLYDGKHCDFYDNSCLLNPNDIISNSGKQVLDRPTYVLYEKANEMLYKDIFSIANLNIVVLLVTNYYKKYKTVLKLLTNCQNILKNILICFEKI